MNPKSKICSTLCGPVEMSVQDGESIGLSSAFPGVDLNEPGGICIDPACENLYIADTNNHEIKVLVLSTGKCHKVRGV